MSLFKNKNFSYLFYATMISNLGSSIFNFIGGWYILEKTGSTLSMGTYLSIPYLVHILFSPFIGVICDCFDGKKIVVITDLINGILMFGIWLVLMMNL